ncbi:hypothetical protein MNBD_NITROSPINAE01-297 [hydrothermal vent metagenome]|uniref:Amidohydrolase-related domain-containing protein n=1 Tax=hydrothermal vent metagenome TaxID=652676 RepID=A0A3B1C0H7_9ZZZZ
MIIDSHVHLVTAGMIDKMLKRYDGVGKGIASKAFAQGNHGFISNSFIKFLKGMSIRKHADLWATELDKNKIDRALFLPISENNDELFEFIKLHPNRFTGYVYLDKPASKQGVKTLKKWIETGAFRGLKLYPTIQGVSAADERLFPLYEMAGRLSIPILFHFGITMAPIYDYRYTNPIDLSLPSRLFPDTNFIIAHFGAGYFREALMLGYRSHNIHLDTSGTNNWREYLPDVMPLNKIFKRALEVYGPKKILFGTDSILNDKAGYRSHILKEQKKALSSLKVTKKDRDLLMGGTAVRLFGL